MGWGVVVCGVWCGVVFARIFRVLPCSGGVVTVNRNPFKTKLTIRAKATGCGVCVVV